MKALSDRECLEVTGGCPCTLVSDPTALGEERESFSTYFRVAISWIISNVSAAWHFVEEQIFQYGSGKDR